MNYLGFFCLGLGIFTFVAGLLSLVISLVSKEPAVKFKARRIAMVVLPFAMILLVTGANMALFHFGSEN